MDETKKVPYRARITIDVDAFIHNLKTLMAPLLPDTKMIVVVKADGYGHGAIPLSLAAENLPFVDGFALATCEEAKDLRNAGIQKNLFILGETFPDPICDEMIIQNHIVVSVSSYERAKALSLLATQNHTTIDIQIKVNTGMNRLGFTCEDSSMQDIVRISKLSGLNLVGLFTHFARADEVDNTLFEEPFSEFIRFKTKLEQCGVHFPMIHCANSAATLKNTLKDMTHVRCGVAMYGLPPSDALDISDLEPIMSLKSCICFLKTVPKGSAIGYGGTSVTKRESKVATIPIGYGDGYPRSLSNKGYVLIRGKKAPILGRICMDQFMVDVTDIEDVSLYDEVTLIGKDGALAVDIRELSELSGRFPYEFACCLDGRLEKEFIQKEK